MLFTMSRILTNGKKYLLWLEYFAEKRLTGFTATVTDFIIHSSTQISGTKLINICQENPYLMGENCKLKVNWQVTTILYNLQLNSQHCRGKQ